VAAIYLWEAVQTFVLTENAFEVFARGYGNVVYLDRMGHLWFSVPVMCGVGKIFLFILSPILCFVC